MKKPLICIPGLGGHPSVFAEYAALLPEYDLRSIEFVSRDKALADARAAISAAAAANGPVPLFCHCYSAQMGIQLAAEMPDKVSELIFLEPFFAELQPWMKILQPITLAAREIVKFFGRIGVRRRKFSYQPDYIALAKYPIYIQPLFDMRWQNLPDYFDKCYDILTYKLPQRVNVPTLMIFSPNGFSRDPANKEHLKTIFLNARLVEMKAGTHNVITMGAAPVAETVREYLKAD
jgi:pimeloyl-ACP methyl ester carboxylesterase